MSINKRSCTKCSFFYFMMNHSMVINEPSVQVCDARMTSKVVTLKNKNITYSP
jgi:hypothetical protein